MAFEGYPATRVDSFYLATTPDLILVERGHVGHRQYGQADLLHSVGHGGRAWQRSGDIRRPDQLRSGHSGRGRQHHRQRQLVRHARILWPHCLQ